MLCQAHVLIATRSGAYLTPHYTALHYTTLHYTSTLLTLPPNKPMYSLLHAQVPILHHTTLHYTTLHYTIPQPYLPYLQTSSYTHCDSFRCLSYTIPQPANPTPHVNPTLPDLHPTLDPPTLMYIHPLSPPHRIFSCIHPPSIYPPLISPPRIFPSGRGHLSCSAYGHGSALLVSLSHSRCSTILKSEVVVW